jgi:Xaa-Pro aminopeptidase
MQIRGRTLPLATYRQRRSAVARRLATDHAGPVPFLGLGVPAHDAAAGLNPTVGRARQDAWFDWFTGCHEADAALLVDPGGAARDTLFLEPGDPGRVVWEGARLPPGSEARRAFGVHATRPVSELKSAVLAAAERAGGRLAMLWRKREPGFQSQQVPTWRRRLRGVSLLNAEGQAVPLRMVKTAEEIAWHRQAVAVTATGLKAVLRELPRMKTEAQVAGELLRHYLSAGHDPIAFATIVGGGINAATLHYPHNDQALPQRGCVLIDSGATAGGYCADVTRTLPHHGRFSDRRFRELYELVLQCMELGRRHARPGVTLEELNQVAWQPILEAGLTRHHNLSHHIGLEVHDPSDRDRPLAPGMLISNEPGVYLPDEGIGIRIEDDLLITSEGCEVTTLAIPKTVAAVERAMG